MTDDVPSRVAAALDRNEAFEETGEATYAVTTPFEAEVRVTAPDPPTYGITVRVPTLSAAVEGEVAEVVENGWLETFERRMEDAYMPLSGVEEIDPSVAVEGREVVVAATIEDPDPRRGVSDVRTLVDYVEGTYLEGVIPGYHYRDPVASMRQQARQDYDANEDV